MTQYISPNRAGLAVGAVFALFHLCWAMMIALGFAQPMIDFMLWLHMIKPFIVVDAFSIGRAVGLIVLTGVIGYLMGAVFAALWNWMHR